MPLGGLIKRGQASVSRFFNSTLPSNARKGVRFMNTHIIPFAKNVHKVSRAIGNEITSQETVPEHIKKKVHAVSNFSDLGMSRLDQIQRSTNKVADQLGLS